jgi:hypothetical protein
LASANRKSGPSFGERYVPISVAIRLGSVQLARVWARDLLCAPAFARAPGVGAM